MEPTYLVTKKSLAKIIAEKHNMERSEVKLVVDSVFQEILKVMENGGAVDISYFGRFEVSHRASREGYNPSTKGRMIIPAWNAPKFRASKTLKDAVNRYKK